MAASIFLSYRREDSAATCGRIYDRLVAHFGRGAVFKDVDSIPAGVDYRVHVNGILDQCALQLVVIGARWLSVTDASGTRRLEQPNDLVRLEIEAALGRNIPVIPLLVDGAAMPHEGQLPASLQLLAYRNALPVRYDPDFDNDTNRLIEAVERLVPAPAPQTPLSPRMTTEQASVNTETEAAQSKAWDATNDPTYKQSRPQKDKNGFAFKTIAFGQHRIDVQAGATGTGHQRVWFDGVEVSQGHKLSSFGHKTYAFVMHENGQDVYYEVDANVNPLVWAVTAKADVRIRRNGVEIYRD